MNGPTLKTEGEWQAEQDARTMLESEKIKDDANRHLKAQNVMKRMLIEKQKEVDDMKKMMNAKMDYSKSMKELKKNG